MDGNNSIGDFIKSVFPSTIDRNSVVFKGLLADTEESPGTMEKLLMDFHATRDRWGGNDVYKQTGDQLERTFEYISVLKRLFEEKDDRFKFRNKILFQRNGDQLWGDYWNILKMFRTYFNNEYLFIVNNTDAIENNCIVNGDFETEDFWSMSGGFSLDKDARFSGSYGLKILNNGYCRQQVTLPHADKTYFLHFFLTGSIKVSITNSSGKYWNPAKGEFGDWQDSVYYESFHSTDWENKSIYFLPGSDTSVTVSFEYDNDYAYLDYVRLFEKPSYPTFTIISTLELEYTDDTANLAPYKDDPVARPDYSAAGYGWHNKDDVDPDAAAATYENASYTDQEAVTEDESPALLTGTEDRGAEDMSAADYMTEEVPLTGNAPNGNDDFKSIDYNKMSYWEQAYIAGAGGARGVSAYNELIEIVKAYGTVHFVELLAREAEV